MKKKPANEALQEASALFVAGRLEETKRACRKLLARRPDIAEAHVLLGEIHRQGGDDARARECHARALKLRPEWSEAHLPLAMGNLFGDYGRYLEAEECYRRALELKPDLADARYNLAAALNASGRQREALAELQELLRIAPDASDARVQLLKLLYDERRFDEMEALARQGVALHAGMPYYPNRLGVALWWRGQHEEALAAFRLAAEFADPESEEFAEARFLEGSSLLSLGRYAAGWQAYRWRTTRRPLRAAHPELVDDPRVVAAASAPSRLRIVCEQGLGDEVFFLRFAPALRERGHRLFVACAPKLAPLLASMPHLVESVNTGEAADFTLASGDLPLASGRDFAPPLPLPVDPARLDAMAARLSGFGPPPYIAVTWRAGLLPDEPKPEGSLYFAKHLPVELLGGALRPVNARVIVVQRRSQADDLRRLAEALGREALDLSAMNDDLRDAVALLSLVDEYVGVSNTNFHLRAGLEKSTGRVLVFTPAEWRWGLQGSATPWFPDFVLYRASAGRDWSNALSRLRSDLATSAALQQINVGI